MRYLLLLLPLVAAGCTQNYDAYGRAYGAYGSDYYGQSTAGGYYGGGYQGQYPAYASGYGSRSDYGYNEGYYGRPYYGGENCGTPDEPKGCPPMPREPLEVLPR